VITALPLTVTCAAVISSEFRVPPTVKSLVIDTLSVNPTLIWLLVTVVLTSLAVPYTLNVSVPRDTVSVPESPAMARSVEIVAPPAAVNRPCASTVNVGIEVELP